MNSYKYKAVDVNGACIKGIYECDSEIELGKALKSEGYYITKYSLYKSKNTSRFFKKKLKAREASMFCRNISSLLGTGINITEVLNILKQQSENNILKDILSKLEVEVQMGNSFYESIKKYDYFFPKFMINMIAVGEESGNLETVLIDLAEYYETIDLQFKKIKKAISYPITVFILTIIICIYIVTNIIPMFASTLSSLESNIPNSTQRIIDVSLFFKNNQVNILLSIGVITTIICLYSLSPKGVEFRENIKFKLPFWGRFFRKLWEMKFAYSMSIMLNKGLNVVLAMKIIEDTVSESFKIPVKRCIKKIEEGNNLHLGLMNIEFLSPTLISLIQIGEKTGELDKMFYKSSQIIRDDLDLSLEKAISYIEPIMISVISVIVGTLIFLFMKPIFSIMDSL